MHIPSSLHPRARSAQRVRSAQHALRAAAILSGSAEGVGACMLGFILITWPVGHIRVRSQSLILMFD
jgi:hypothetical protein